MGRAVAGCCWAAVLLAAVTLIGTRLRVENPRGLWTIRPEPAPTALWTFAQRLFGNREVLLVAVSGPADHGTTVREAAADLERWLREQPEVAGTFGVLTVGRLDRRLRLLGRAGELGELRAAVFAPDTSVAVLYVTLLPPPSYGSLALKQALIGRIESERVPQIPAGTRLMLSGQPAVDVALDRLLRADMATAVPVALGCVALVLFITLGWRCLAPALAVSAAVTVLLGGFAATATPISSATAVTLPLTVIVGISYGVHVTLARERLGSLRAALRAIGRPLAWSYGTTVVAVATFVLSPIRALRIFAVSATVAITLALLASLTLLPLLRVRFSGETRTGRRTRSVRSAFATFAGAARHPWLTASGWIAVAVLGAVGVLRIQVEPNSYLGFFSAGHPIVDAHRTLDAALGGSLPLEILVDVDSGTAYRQQRVHGRIGTLLAAARRTVRFGPAFRMVEPSWLARDSALAERLAGWFGGEDAHYTRVIVLTPILSTAAARDLVATMDSLASTLSGDGVRMRITGMLPAALPMQQALVTSQLESLGLLLAVVAASLVVLTRSVRRAVVLLTPNVLPLFVVGAAMGILGIPLDFTTVCVASLVLGVSVDDTLQITWAGRRERPGGASFSPAWAMRRVTAPALLGMLGPIVGAAALLASPFAPTARLGGLLTLGLVVAVFADLTLTPLLLAVGRHGPTAPAERR